MKREYKTVMMTISLSGKDEKATEKFDAEVTELMSQGWKPHGSMLTADSSAGFIKLLQPMTLIVDRATL